MSPPHQEHDTDTAARLQRENDHLANALASLEARLPTEEDMADPAALERKQKLAEALKGDPAALYFIGYPGDGTTIIRTWVQQGGPQRFLFNDGMNAADFIKGVGPQFLANAFGTSSGTTKTPSTEFFASAYPAMSGGFDAGAPAADRAFDAGAILGRQRRPPGRRRAQGPRCRRGRAAAGRSKRSAGAGVGRPGSRDHGATG